MSDSMTVKELPVSERPYEKCMKYGAAALSDAELLSVIIRTGTHGERSVDLAGRILNAGPDGLLNIIYLSCDDLKKLHGIGTVKALQLKCVGELAKRISTATRYSDICLARSDTIAAYYMERMRHERRELLILSMFDSKNMLIADEILSCGTSNMALVSPAEIYRSALRSGAQYIIILHNHPSGDPKPSNEDIRVTDKIKKCGILLDILLMDHIIIGDNRYFSFREQNLLSLKG